MDIFGIGSGTLTCGLSTESRANMLATDSFPHQLQSNEDDLQSPKRFKALISVRSSSPIENCLCHLSFSGRAAEGADPEGGLDRRNSEPGLPGGNPLPLELTST